MFCDMADAICPGLKFIFLIQVVVPFFGWDEWIIGEPGVIPASVQTNITNTRRRALRRFHGAADHELINVTETDAPGMQQREEFFVIPSAMADLDDERVIAEPVEELL